MSSSNKAFLLEGATTNLKRSNELASEKGTSNCLIVLPLQEHKFPFTKLPFTTLFLSDMDGVLPGFLNIAPVELSSPLNIPLHVPRVASLQSVTMKSMT